MCLVTSHDIRSMIMRNSVNCYYFEEYLQDALQYAYFLEKILEEFSVVIQTRLASSFPF